MSAPLLVLDASPLFNLLGSGAPEVILRAVSNRCWVEENTLKEVQRNPFDRRPAAPALRNLIEQRMLKVGRMGAIAYEQYLQMVASDAADSLGRGESAAIAYANEIGATIVLDDRKARRIAKRNFPKCDQMTSIELLRHAADVGRISQRQIASIVQLAIANSRMHVLAEERKWLSGLGL